VYDIKKSTLVLEPLLNNQVCCLHVFNYYWFLISNLILYVKLFSQKYFFSLDLKKKDISTILANSSQIFQTWSEPNKLIKKKNGCHGRCCLQRLTWEVATHGYSWLCWKPIARGSSSHYRLS